MLDMGSILNKIKNKIILNMILKIGSLKLIKKFVKSIRKFKKARKAPKITSPKSFEPVWCNPSVK